MKKKAILAFGGISLFLLIVSSNVYLFSKALQPVHLSFTPDYLFSDHSNQIFAQYINRQSTLTKSATKMYDELNQEIPALQQISINYKGSQRAHARLQAVQPAALIKIGAHPYVLTENSQLLDALYYNQQFTGNVPELYATSALLQEKNGPLTISKVLQKIPPTIFADYTITWHNQTEIILQHSGLKNFYIVTDHKTQYTDKVLLALETIKKLLEEKNRKIDWKADIRFNEQIVLSPYKKGGV